MNNHFFVKISKWGRGEEKEPKYKDLEQGRVMHHIKALSFQLRFTFQKMSVSKKTVMIMSVLPLGDCL